MIAVLVALAGGVGAAARFAFDTWLMRRTRAWWPVGTFTINVSGALALGLIAGWCGSHTGLDGWQAVLGTGFLGGYTTFSAASVETVRLARRRSGVSAVAYAAATLVAAVSAATLGLFVTG